MTDENLDEGESSYLQHRTVWERIVEWVAGLGGGA